jgi:membrane protease YdiL (CAAX protease family)
MIPQPEPFPPPTPHNPPPFFDYTDLLFFIGLCVPCLLIAALLVRVAAVFIHTPAPVMLLFIMTVWYLLAFGSVAALFRIRYHRPFWQSLGWRPISFSAAVGAILAGPLLVISIGLLGLALRMPQVEPPFEQMLRSPGTIVFFGILAVIFGPVAEELAFRGFLLPLLIRSLGAAGGILITGFIFGCMHGYEYEWSWRHMLLISLVGCAFGWAKYKTKSTAAAVFMHSTFNLTQFAALLWQARTL